VLPGRKSEVMPWLREALGKAGYGRGEGGERRYDAATADRVRKFQRDRGLEDDGIVGPLTLIHLNTVIGAAGPRLAGVRG
jgi:general secretion pathway protein A